MRAIILAAGRGSRMKNMTADRPKCLVSVHGKPLLEWQLEALRSSGISDIGIVTGYKGEMLTGYGLTEFHNPHWATTNMVASLACAHEWLSTTACIVSYSDIFYSPSAVRLLLEAQKHPLTVTYSPHWKELWTKRFGDPLLDAETFSLNSDNSLIEIGNKPKTTEEIQGQYMGLLGFSPQAWDEVLRIRNSLSREEQASIHMTATLQKIIHAGKMRIHAVSYTESWGEVDSAEDILCYQNMPTEFWNTLYKTEHN